MPSDRYGRDVLAGEQTRAPKVLTVDAVDGLVVECATSGWCGAVSGWQKGADGWAVVLEDRHGARRPFRLGPSFLIDGELVTLRRPQVVPSNAVSRTASGSRAAAGMRARVARESRIWVEGRQDAELVERVWGSDLRVAGVVVEELGGIDALPARLRDFAPSPERRVGVLVDHLITDSKESRLARAVREEWPGDVLVVGHPYVDVWQAIRPACAGVGAWPVIPPGRPWKDGVCAELGWGSDTGRAWSTLLARVSDFTDLEPDLLAKVEELIDFVTADET